MQEDFFEGLFSTAEFEGLQAGDKIHQEHDHRLGHKAADRVRQKGREEGMEKGAEQAHMNGARFLKALGVSTNIIVKATGLSREIVDAL